MRVALLLPALTLAAAVSAQTIGDLKDRTAPVQTASPEESLWVPKSSD
jgi:hypothetical protein